MSKSKDEIQDEVCAIIAPLRLAGIEVSMAVGKSRIGLKDMMRKYYETAKFLVVVPRRAIIASWKEECKKAGVEFLLAHIKFTTYKSLPEETFDYDTIYLDECHSMTFTHGDYLSLYDRHHNGRIIGLTGTYPKFAKGEKGVMCKRFCPKVFTYTVDEAVDEKMLNDYQIFVHQLRLSAVQDLEIKRKAGPSWKSSELKQYQYYIKAVEESFNPESRYRATIRLISILQSFPTKEKYAKVLLEKQTDKTIVFANTQAQADRLCQHSHHTKNKRSKLNLQLFKDGEINHLSAVEQLSEGVTIPQLKCGIIMHSYANNRKAAQKIGRMLRLNPDDTGTIHILCYADTVDERWVKEALSSFNQSKITWVLPE